jgi:antitoxin CcdA
MPVTSKLLKKPTNISLPPGLYADAKSLGINISQVCERSLREAVRSEQARRWNADNAEFIAAYNAAVEQEELALAQWRAF